MAIKDLEALVASIAHALNASNIPCVLWGHCLLQVHGIPTIVASVDYVIPDDLLPAGSRVLTEIALAQASLLMPCSNPTDCSITAPDRLAPPPSFHVHVKDSDMYVGLYLQRDTLWFLAPLDSLRDDLLLPTADKLPSPLLLATDQKALPPWRPGRGSGFFQPQSRKGEKSPVVVPKAHVLLEALMRIYARDVGTTVGSFGVSMIAYMELYVDNDGWLDVDQLSDVVRELYIQHRNQDMPLRQWIQELQAHLL